MHPSPDSQGASRHTALLLTASLGCAMTVLDTNLVGMVLPSIARDLHASFADIEWVVSAYVLCFAALLLPAGSVADRFGRRRVFLAGIALFAVASLACGMAPSAPTLYLARAAQGVGAAFLLAPALANIGHTFRAEDERARAWAIWGAIMGLAMVVSPLIGGVLNTYIGWRSAFYINLPICAYLAVMVIKHIGESRDPTPRTLDIPGIVLFAAAMFSFTWALILGPESGWGSGKVLLRVVTGLALFSLFVLVERRREHPMLDMTLFRLRPFVGAIVAMFTYAASAQVMASLLPLFLQNARGESTLAAGARMLPFALAMLLLPQVGRLLGRRLASYQILTLGLVLVACGNAWMMWAAGGAGGLALGAGMAILGCGGGLLNGETQKAIMKTVPPQRAGMASGISTTARFSGILIGFTGLGAAMADGVRMNVLAKIGLLQTPVPAGFLDKVVAGDLERAAAMYPAEMTQTLIGIGRAGYGAGFAQAFLAAALAAAIAAVFVYISMRTPARQPVAQFNKQGAQPVCEGDT